MSHIPYLSFQKCCGCRENLRNKNLKKHARRISEATIQKTRTFFNNDSINIADFICNMCRSRVNSNSKHLIISKDSVANSGNPEEVVNEIISEMPSSPVESIEIDEQKNPTISKALMLPTAYASHKHCLLCKNTKGLRTIKAESIMHAYAHHGIVIKHHSRCCDNHIDNNGLINTHEFKEMPTKVQPYDKNMIAILDVCVATNKKIQYQLEHESGIFDKFKDMATLDEALCIKVTGWTREQFDSFSKNIKCVRDTNGRTKEQLIAIYRFWLSKGIDQCTLAMFKSNTTQQQISHYLAQIRDAINKDFVPLFLGANKGKRFFLKHNTESVKVLHDLKDETLAVVVDGTYTRLEKSTNNDFQYVSYSLQKSHNLIKPFIMCCADGYFIDCYGPFQANHNDAQIFRYILSTDEDLQELFTPRNEIIMFLDRGFRDSYCELVEDGFNVQIPTCVQLERKKSHKLEHTSLKEKTDSDDVKDETVKIATKALTTKQTGNSRLVTKVRFIVEKQNGLLKNKKALDNIRNTQAGHIQIDYRIACAMANFNMKLCIPDGDDSVEIAKSLKKRCQKTQNKLESLLRMSLSTLQNVQDFQTIECFPLLSLRQLRKKITFGCFKLRQCPSYIDQVIGHGKAYFLEGNHLDSYTMHPKVMAELKCCKVLAVQIPSRFKKRKLYTDKNNSNLVGETDDIDAAADFKNAITFYKVFIQYIPAEEIENAQQSNILKTNHKPHNLIKRYICSCLSGHQVAGCCIHIATVIFYLSYAKHIMAKNPQNLKLPATHLKSIIININNFEKSNAPRYIRHKRRSKNFIQKESEILSSACSSSEVSSDDDQEAKLENKRIKLSSSKKICQTALELAAEGL